MAVGSSDPVEIDPALAPIRDVQSVTPAGERLGPALDGVRLRSAVTHSDERGTLCEIYDPRWAFTDEPIVYVYEGTVRPGQKKGWVVHSVQDDRLFFNSGAAKIVLYDARPSSPTHELIQEVFLGEANRGLLRIPAGVFHAVVNLGTVDLRFLNMPTQAYCHEDPDKHLPAHRHSGHPLRALRIAAQVRMVGAMASDAYVRPRPRALDGPLVTVVMATYNRSEVLGYALDSAIRQTYRNLEILVVGDACTDDSEQVVADAGDLRVRWMNLEANSGSQSGPNEAGLRAARGDLIANLGQDDLWRRDHVALLVAELERNAVEASSTIVTVIWPPPVRVRRFSSPPAGERMPASAFSTRERRARWWVDGVTIGRPSVPLTKTSCGGCERPGCASRGSVRSR